MNLTGIQYIILTTYQFIDVARFAILDPETGTLWIDFFPPITIVIGILPDGNLVSAGSDYD
ncbi:hypothetical protein RIF25_11305 [Thermosynechococcaceae cyanobacterium BACA0444]|uniref:Uncharacterized protein n=1 Tax=Pseudocalidococcus azoricus BACA0444 TaxID=2918990 RepID=A0AAE4FSA0_9CYAN|nr:hypothetical protein [Pseudocalidococcus azoricus]MDS3861393.1 hypothetical protein [Pseudocalidococcus azoricus BACA0444]